VHPPSDDRAKKADHPSHVRIRSDVLQTLLASPADRAAAPSDTAPFCGERIIGACAADTETSSVVGLPTRRAQILVARRRLYGRARREKTWSVSAAGSAGRSSAVQYMPRGHICVGACAARLT
jgi:hypothetical protein